jgi:hypothetical protein
MDSSSSSSCEDVLKRIELNSGRNALHLAVLMDNFKIAEYLISCGIDCSHLDSFGKRPIDYIENKNGPLFALLFLSTNRQFQLGSSSISIFSMDNLLKFKN